MSDFLEMLKGKKGFISLGSVTMEKIDDAERSLSLSFSEEYKEYVARYSCVSFVGHELTGICESLRLNVVNATNREKEIFQTVPSTWYVVEEANFDGIVIWQDSTGMIYQTSPGKQPIQLCSSLDEYIRMC